MFEKGRVAVVTGGGSGIGRSIAMALGREGVKVAILDLNQDAMNETDEAMNSNGFESFPICIDISKREDCYAAVNSVIAKWGRIDLLVNCAGILIDNTIKKITEDVWDKVHAINLKGPLFCMQAVQEHMKAQGYGRILNMTSAAYLGNAGQGAYSSSKAGLVALTKVAAQEYSRFGVTVNCIAPGMVETPMTANIPSEIFDKIVAGIPLGRVGYPDDISHMAIALLADAAGYVTGQVVFVDGGSTLRRRT